MNRFAPAMLISIALLSARCQVEEGSTMAKKEKPETAPIATEVKPEMKPDIKTDKPESKAGTMGSGELLPDMKKPEVLNPMTGTVGGVEPKKPEETKPEAKNYTEDEVLAFFDVVFDAYALKGIQIGSERLPLNDLYATLETLKASVNNADFLAELKRRGIKVIDISGKEGFTSSTKTLQWKVKNSLEQTLAFLKKVRVFPVQDSILVEAVEAWKKKGIHFLSEVDESEAVVSAAVSEQMDLVEDEDFINELKRLGIKNIQLDTGTVYYKSKLDNEVGLMWRVQTTGFQMKHYLKSLTTDDLVEKKIVDEKAYEKELDTALSAAAEAWKTTGIIVGRQVGLEKASGLKALADLKAAATNAQVLAELKKLGVQQLNSSLTAGYDEAQAKVYISWKIGHNVTQFLEYLKSLDVSQRMKSPN